MRHTGMTPPERAAASQLVDRLTGRGLEQLVDELVLAATAADERVLLTEGDRALTGGEVAHAFDQLPRALVAHGLRPGNVVLFGVSPGIDALLLLLAALRAGAIVTFVEGGSSPEHAEQRLQQFAPDWVMADSMLYVASARTPLRGYLRRRGFTMPHLAALANQHVRVGRALPFVPRGLSLDGLLIDPAASTVELPTALDLDAPGLVSFTSAATDAPQAVQHTGRSMTATVRQLVEHIELPAGSVMHTHNLHAMLVAILRGAATIVAPMKPSPERFLRDLHEHDVTHTFGSPASAVELVQLCESTEQRLPDGLQQMTLYAAAVAAGELDRLHAIAHQDLVVDSVYALAQQAPVAWIDSRDKRAWRGEGDVVGRMCSAVEWRIDARGELHVRGESAARDGWHATGDRARMDDDGNLVLVGRVRAATRPRTSVRRPRPTPHA